MKKEDKILVIWLAVMFVVFAVTGPILYHYQQSKYEKLLKISTVNVAGKIYPGTRIKLSYELISGIPTGKLVPLAVFREKVPAGSEVITDGHYISYDGIRADIKPLLDEKAAEIGIKHYNTMITYDSIIIYATPPSRGILYVLAFLVAQLVAIIVASIAEKIIENDESAPSGPWGTGGAIKYGRRH